MSKDKNSSIKQRMTTKTDVNLLRIQYGSYGFIFPKLSNYRFIFAFSMLFSFVYSVFIAASVVLLHN